MYSRGRERREGGKAKGRKCGCTNGRGGRCKLDVGITNKRIRVLVCESGETRKERFVCQGLGEKKRMKE